MPVTENQAKSVEIKTISPSYNRRIVIDDNSLRELPWIGKINLRGDADNIVFLGQTKQSLRCNLPTEANTLIKHGTLTVFWLGPDEWLIYCDIEQTEELSISLKNALSGIHHAVTDVSDYYTVLQLEGPEVITILSKGCPLNMNSYLFPPSSCAQTRFGHASVLLHKLNTVPAFNIQVRWSYTEYVWNYLVSAMSTLES